MITYTQKVSCLIMLLFIISFFIGIPQTKAQNSPPLQKTPAINSLGKKLGGRYIVYGDLGGRLNPDGLSFFGGIKYRDVYRYDEKYDTASAYWQAGLGAGVSPAMLQASAHLEWQPWIFLPMRIQYDYYKYFGTSGGLLSFAAPNAPYGDHVRNNRSDEESTHGQRFLFQPTIQVKFDRFIIRNQTDLAYYKFSGQGPYFLELIYDTLLKDNDYLAANRTFFLYSVFPGAKDKTLLAGPFYEITRSFDAHITQQKVGFSFYWEPAASLWFISRPYLGITTGYHLQDPNRLGDLFLTIGTGFQFGL